MNRKANARTVCVDGFDVTLDAQIGAFLVRRGDARPLRFPPLAIRQFIVSHGARVRSAAIRLALNSETPMSFFSTDGVLKGHLQPPLSPRLDLRIAQYRAHADARVCIGLARRLVHAKLEGCHRTLRRFKGPLGRSVSLALEQAHRAVSAARRLDELRGIEGSAARRYFEALAEAVGDALPFTGRNRQPPADPINAFLSYGYSVLGRDLAGKLELAGLDPFAGFLHEPGYGRPALALDLIEPLRSAVIDRLALELLARGELTEEDFTFEKHGVLLARQGKAKFFAGYEARVRSRSLAESASPAGSLLHEVAGALAAALRDDALNKWQPVPESCRNLL